MLSSLVCPCFQQVHGLALAGREQLHLRMQTYASDTTPELGRLTSLAIKLARLRVRASSSCSRFLARASTSRFDRAAALAICRACFWCSLRSLPQAMMGWLSDHLPQLRQVAGKFDLAFLHLQLTKLSGFLVAGRHAALSWVQECLQNKTAPGKASGHELHLLEQDVPVTLLALLLRRWTPPPGALHAHYLRRPLQHLHVATCDPC